MGLVCCLVVLILRCVGCCCLLCVLWVCDSCLIHVICVMLYVIVVWNVVICERLIVSCLLIFDSAEMSQ